MNILGIESSCDETAAAIIEDGHILKSNIVASSMDLHREFGGVVPEIAARSHIEEINPVIKNALTQANMTWEDIDAIAVTMGPGLGGSLLVGVLTARTLARVKNKPLIGVNHVIAHMFASFIDETNLENYKINHAQPHFPLLALIVSGGHTQLMLFNSPDKYKIIGRTTDDAVGEAYDKVAKILGLPYPGGPSVEKLAEAGDAYKYKLPKAKTEKINDFSYSGIKTAVLRLAQTEIGQDFSFPSYKLANALSEAQKTNIAAVFNRVAVEYLVDKTLSAYNQFAPKSVVVAGGVSASPQLRKQLTDALPIEPHFPDPKLCTDNAAMIATAAFYSQRIADPLSLEADPSLGRN